MRTLTSERALVSSAKAERGGSWRECCTKLHDCENEDKNLLAQKDIIVVDRSNGQRDRETDTRMVPINKVDGQADVLVFVLRNSSCIVCVLVPPVNPSTSDCCSHTAFFHRVHSSSKKKSSDLLATLDMLIAPFACTPTLPTLSYRQPRHHGRGYVQTYLEYRYLTIFRTQWPKGPISHLRNPEQLLIRASGTIRLFGCSYILENFIQKFSFRF